MGRELYGFVAPLGGSVLTGNQSRPVYSSKIAIDECIPGFGLVTGTICEAEVPLSVRLPGV